MAERTVTVYEILFDGTGSGAAGDGTHTYRTRDECEAREFAARNTCWGQPATVSSVNAPLRIARRWGV